MLSYYNTKNQCSADTIRNWLLSNYGARYVNRIFYHHPCNDCISTPLQALDSLNIVPQSNLTINNHAAMPTHCNSRYLLNFNVSFILPLSLSPAAQHHLLTDILSAQLTTSMSAICVCTWPSFSGVRTRNCSWQQKHWWWTWWIRIRQSDTPKA